MNSDLIDNLIAVAFLVAAAWAGATMDFDAGCSTDSECAVLCAADDADCDGGPQQ